MGIDYDVVVEMLNYLNLQYTKVMEADNKMREIIDAEGSVTELRYAQKDFERACEHYNESKETIAMAINITSRGKKQYYNIFRGNDNKHRITLVEL